MSETMDVENMEEEEDDDEEEGEEIPDPNLCTYYQLNAIAKYIVCYR